MCLFLLFATTTTTMNKWIDLLSFWTTNSCVIRITADLDDGCCSQKWSIVEIEPT
jgi:hypothetical protein